MAQAVADEMIKAGPALYTDKALSGKLYEKLLELAVQPTQHKAIIDAFKQDGDLLVKLVYKMFKDSPDKGQAILKLHKEAVDAYGVGSVSRVICAPGEQSF